MIDIDKHIPLPANVKYPWRTMEVGDSFIAPAGFPRSYAYERGRALGRKFATSLVDDRRVRVWRTA